MTSYLRSTSPEMLTPGELAEAMNAKEKFYKMVGKTPDDLTQEDFDDIGPLLQLMPTHVIASYLNIPDWKVAAVEFELKELNAL